MRAATTICQAGYWCSPDTLAITQCTPDDGDPQVFKYCAAGTVGGEVECAVGHSCNYAASVQTECVAGKFSAGGLFCAAGQWGVEVLSPPGEHDTDPARQICGRSLQHRIFVEV